MRLIEVSTLDFVEISDVTNIKYAILSHRWEDEEVLYAHMTKRRLRQQISRMKGFHKIYTCCQQAARDGYKYAWVDTCCIDKSSSAELQEAINSMYGWYAGADVCYAYLSDVHDPVDELNFTCSRWFERGWTLQELLAPKKLIFFNSFWRTLGTRSKMRKWVTKATGIPSSILEDGYDHTERPCIANIMSWAAGRKTTRIEDRAYSLLGLFGVSMPMLYGEGTRAFERLQEEILRETEDQSIFAWIAAFSNSYGPLPTLATSPKQFGHLGHHDGRPIQFQPSSSLARRRPHSITNEGISLDLDLMPLVPRVYVALLNVEAMALGTVYKIGFFVERLDKDDRYIRIMGRTSAWKHDLAYIALTGTPIVYKRRKITIVRRLHRHEIMISDQMKSSSFRLVDLPEQEMYDSAVEAGYRMEGIVTQVRDGLYDRQTKIWTAALKERKNQIAFQQPGITGNLGTYRRLLGYHKQQVIFFGFDFDYCPSCIVCTQDELPTPTILDEIIFASSGFRSGPEALPSMALDVDRGGVWQAFRDDTLLIKATMASTDSCDGFSANIIFNDAASTRLSITLRRDGSTYPWDVHVYLNSKIENVNEQPGDFATWHQNPPVVGDVSEQFGNLSTGTA